MLMRAATREAYCQPDEIIIAKIPRPVPASDEVLVKVHATTVNRTDCANLTAQPFIMRFVLGLRKPREIVLGTDFAGEVVATGEAVNDFKVGDRVFSFLDNGCASQAEYLTVKAENLFSIPDGVNYKQAAASLEGANYAYTFVHKVDIQAGQHILINGATGAIGSALLQFVRQYDVDITATCNTKNLDLIKSLGANTTIDYTREDFTTSSTKFDFIFDSVGKSTFGKCKPLLKPGGTYISSELGPYAQNVYLPLSNKFTDHQVIFPIPYSKHKTIPYISKALAAGTFRPLIDREYTLNDIAEAYTYVMTGQKTGNVVILTA